MQKRKLGKSGLEIVPLVFGGNVFGWTADEATSFDLLDAFADRGFDAVDTANVYSVWIPGHQGGESETILGKWFARSGKRKQVVLATKVGFKMGDGGQGLKKDYILKSVEESCSACRRTTSISTSRTRMTRTRRLKRRWAPMTS